MTEVIHPHPQGEFPGERCLVINGTEGFPPTLRPGYVEEIFAPPTKRSPRPMNENCDMSESTSDDSGSSAAELYGEAYYASGCGSIAYDRSEPHWAAFFGNIADDLVRTFRPRRVFDAGCALGFLVEALWDRGVVTCGRDISEYAISKTRADIRPFCSVGSLTDPIEGHFDLVVCIEVLEHMTEQDGMRAIANMTAVADRIVFSSSPEDLNEPTHINVKPPIYWVQAFAEHGFAPSIETTLFSITPYALVFERNETKPSNAFLSACAEIVRGRMKSVAHARTVHELSLALSEKDRALAVKTVEYDRLAAERDRVHAEQAIVATAQVHLRDDFERALAENAALRLAQSQSAAERERLEKERLESIRVSLNEIVETNARLQSLNDQISRSRLWRLGRKLRRVASRGRSMLSRFGQPFNNVAGPPRGSRATASARIQFGLDPEFYLGHYPDIAQAGVDPLEHYILHGQHEGRAPSLYALKKNERRHRAAPELMRLHDLCDPEHDEVGPKVSDEAFLISVITPTYNAEPRYIRELHQTLSNQSYANWEWVVVDDGSTRPASIPILREIAERDSRVRFACSPANLGIAGASNAALASALGSYVALVDHDDLISRNAFLSVYQAWKAAPQAQIFYTDECMLQPDGNLTDLWAKPDWSPAYLEYTMCLGHLSVYGRTFLNDLGGFRSEFDETQDYDLALRALLRDPTVVHVPVFAYLWRAIAGSAATGLNEKPRAIERQARAVLEYARQRHPDAVVTPGFFDGYWRIRYPLPSPPPLLSYVIPAGGGVRAVRGGSIDLVLNCVKSFENTAFYPNREYIVVHNGNLTAQQVEVLHTIPGVRLLLHADPSFNFSRTVNAGVAAAHGDYICLLNDDIEAITPQGGEEIVSYLSVNPNVGALGPKCLFEDGSIQQCGVVLLEHMGPAHAGAGGPRDFGGHRMNLMCRREVFAIGAAILFMRKALFEEVGGFKEDLPLNYNDVDFSLRLRDRGYTCVVDPAVEVYHFESATKIGTAMVEQERMFLGRADTHDPYFSKWFDPGRPDFQLNLNAPDRLPPFGAWLDRHIARRAAALDQTGGPRVSICLLVTDQPIHILDEALRSATMQTHTDVQLLVLDRGVRESAVRQWFTALGRRGLQTVESVALNDLGAFAREVLDRIDGEFVVFLDGADFISVDAVQILASQIKKNPSKTLFYTDHYEANEHSTRRRPFFKPDFDPVLLSNLWFPSNLLAARKELVRQACEMAPREPISGIGQTLVAHAMLNGEEPHHIRELAYARRVMADGSEPVAGSSMAGDAHRRAVMRLPQAAGAVPELSVEALSSHGDPLLHLRAGAPVPRLTILAAQQIWGAGGSGVAGLKAVAAEAGVEWIALLLAAGPEQDHALCELSALAMFDKRVNAVCGVLVDTEVVHWSGGLFLPGGRVFDPQAGQPIASGGFQGLLSCQRCIDVGAPVNVLFRAAAIARVIERFDVVDGDGLMVALGLDAHERDEFVCVTPHLRAGVAHGLGMPPADRRGVALHRPSLVDGSRWYDGRLGVERPYEMPGCG